jgi:hypothetical protein
MRAKSGTAPGSSLIVSPQCAWPGSSKSSIRARRRFPVAFTLDDLDFSPPSGIRAVSLEGASGLALMGKINDAFTPAGPITYLTP